MAPKISHQRLNQKSNQLIVGDLVLVADRFFANHALDNMKFKIGVGQISQVDGEMPYVWASFGYQPSFLEYQQKGYVKEIKSAGKGNIISVKIHPVYLERYKVRRGKKE